MLKLVIKVGGLVNNTRKIFTCPFCGRNIEFSFKTPNRCVCGVFIPEVQYMADKNCEIGKRILLDFHRG
jgi:hypothetical protein